MTEHLYKNHPIILTTKHQKQRALAGPFRDRLGAEVREFYYDTDTLGTFSGEIERQGSALDCVKRKCALGLTLTGVRLGLASEGSFGPHPWLPMVPLHQEILYFIDQERGIELATHYHTEQTNYCTTAVEDDTQLAEFLKQAQFPSHAVIVKGHAQLTADTPLFKGLCDPQKLAAAITKCRQQTGQTAVWLETDMRAHYNPTRMQHLQHAAMQLATRLATRCPACRSPGFGQVDVQQGLPCDWCGQATTLVSERIFGCCVCPYQETHPREDGQQRADPQYCDFCNP